MSNGLYPDQNRSSFGTELGPNYLQIIAADKERVGNLGNNDCKSGEIQMKDVKLITRRCKIYEQKENNLTIIYKKKVPSKFRSRYA